MIKLPHSQKKIIIVTAIGIVVVIIFWNFIYLPAKKEISKISPESVILDGQIMAMERVLSRTKTVPLAKKYLKDRFQELNMMIFQKEDKTIAAFSDFAKRLNIEIISVKQGQKKEFINQFNEKTYLFGKSFNVMSVSVEIKCYYKDLVKYLDLLDTSKLNVMTLERLSIKRTLPKSPRLVIILDFNVYTLS